MFLTLDILFKYWIEHVTFGLLYVMFRFPIRIFYKDVPGFATDCLLYVGPLLGNIAWNDSGFDITENNVSIVLNYAFAYNLMSHNMIIHYFRLHYFHVLNSALFCTEYTGTLLLHRRSPSYKQFYLSVYCFGFLWVVVLILTQCHPCNLKDHISNVKTRLSTLAIYSS